RFVAEQLNRRVREAEAQLAAQVLLQAGVGDARAFELRIGENQTVILIARIGQKTVHQRIQWNPVEVRAEIISPAFDAEVQTGAGADRRAVEAELKRIQCDTAPADFCPGDKVRYGNVP